MRAARSRTGVDGQTFGRGRKEPVVLALLILLAAGLHTWREDLGLTELSLRALGTNPYAAAPEISKAFGATSVAVNGTTSLTFTVSNPNEGIDFTGVSFSDVLPAGLVVASPNGVTNTCGGAVTAVAGSGTVSLAGGVLAGGASCTVVVNVTALQAGTKNNVSSAVTSSEGGEGNTASATLEVTLASPTISTMASPSAFVGAPVRDVATLAGGSSPTGTVIFRLYSDSACSTQVGMSTNPVTGTTATSDWLTPTAVGTYYWTAVYSGDASNSGATSPCNAPNESVAVTAFQAPPYSRTITGDFLGPLTVEAGESVLITNARVVGPVTVKPGGALTVVNSQISRGVTANAPSFLSICGTAISGPSPGPALTVTDASVPIRIGDPATGCAGNRIAGQVILTGNLAVTFGANAVSHETTIDDNGPGTTVIKANTLYGTLSCSGNNPPPTNAGQPNTAASKTGQCAAL